MYGLAALYVKGQVIHTDCFRQQYVWEFPVIIQKELLKHDL